MRILTLTSTYLPNIGGIEFHIQGLVEELCLKYKEFEIDIGEINLKHRKFEIDSSQEYTFFKIPAKGIFPFLIFKKLTFFIKKFNYDLIHIHDPQVAGISFHFLLNNYKIPLILTTHGMMFHTNKRTFFKKIYWRIITKNLIKIYSKIISVSKNDEQKLLEILIPEKIKLIENGINYKKFNIALNKRNYENISFVYFGRFSPNKQVHLIIEIFNKLSINFNNINLLIIGNTTDVDYMKNLFELSKNNNKIQIMNFLEDTKLLEKISASDIFISASKYEGFGMSMLEAMSAGLIPIVNNISPINELVNDQFDGFVLDFNNENIVEKITDILNLKTKRLAEISEESLIKAHSFSWEVKVKEYELLYKGIINEK